MAGTKIGEPLPYYRKGEETWPAIWTLPEVSDEADLFGNVCHLADDLILREAIHIWDNCLRGPSTFGAIQGGLISAHARLLVGSNAMAADLETMADGVRAMWLAQAREAQVVAALGWDGAADDALRDPVARHRSRTRRWGDWLAARHSLFTWRPRLSVYPGQGWSVWWLWFELACVRAEPSHA